MVRDSSPLAVSRFTDNPNSTARRKDSMDKEVLWLETGWRASNPRPLDLRPGALSPLSYIRIGFSFGAIIHNERPIEIGVTNRIRTGTNAFTGRDAAVTS